MPRDFVLNKSELFVAGPISPLGKHVRVFELKTKYPCNANESDFTFVSNVGPNNQRYTRLLVGTGNKQYVVDNNNLELLADKLYKLNLRVNYEGLCYFLTKSRVDLMVARNEVQFYRINEVLDWSMFNAQNPEPLTSRWNRCFIGMNRTCFDFVKYDDDYKKRVNDKDKEIAELKKKLKELDEEKDKEIKELQDKLNQKGDFTSDPFSSFREIIMRRKVTAKSSEIKIQFNTRGDDSTNHFMNIIPLLLTPEDSDHHELRLPSHVISQLKSSDIDYNNWWRIKVKEYSDPIIFYAGNLRNTPSSAYPGDGTITLPFTVSNSWSFQASWKPQYLVGVNKGMLLGYGHVLYIAPGRYNYQYGNYRVLY